MESVSHYDKAYFDWQRSIGEFGGWAKVPQYRGLVCETDTVLDFGCGGGFLLKNLRCAKRYGVEINPTARAIARENGIEVYETTAELPDACADIIISDNALEHTLHPLAELRGLFAKLKPGGRLILIVPCETLGSRYKPNNIHRHLYSWSPMCLGNLLTESGFEVIESKPYVHKWPPKAQLIARYFGRTVFEILARIYARIERSWFQVKAVAIRPTR